MTLTAAAKIELIETALADGKYRTLQKQLRELRDAQQIIFQGYLSDSHESLKAEAQRIILELKPISETKDAIETVEQKTDEVIAFIPTEIVNQKINEVIASLPPDTIVDNSAFGVRINTGTADEKIWLVKKDGNGAGVTFVKTECGQDYIKLSSAIHSQNVTFIKTKCGRYYESYAGDALRSIVLLGLPTFIWAGVLKTQVAVPDVVRLQEDAQKLGLILHLYDRTSETGTPQDATATAELDRQWKDIKTDLDWEKELPETFPEYPKDKGLREKFRRMFNQLNKQGISVYYDPECSDKSTEEWTLAQEEKIGFLYYFRTDKKWEIHGFTFQDEKGNVLDEFADVKSR